MYSNKEDISVRFATLQDLLDAKQFTGVIANNEFLFCISKKNVDTKLSLKDAIDELEKIQLKISEESQSETNRRNIVKNFFNVDAKKNLILNSTKPHKDSKVSFSLKELRQITNNFTNLYRATPEDFLSSYHQAGKFIEKISPHVKCYYQTLDTTNGKLNKNEVGAIAIADALSILVEPNSFGIFPKVGNPKIIKDLFKCLMKFKVEEENGIGFKPGADITVCKISIVESTALACIALTSYYLYLNKINNQDSDLKEIKQIIISTIDWLISNHSEDGYWPRDYPSIHATQVSTVALILNPFKSPERNIEKSITWIKNSLDSNTEKSHIDYARIIWTLLTYKDTTKKMDADEHIKKAMKSLKSYILDNELDTYYSQAINIPSNGKPTRISWPIPEKPFILSTILLYFYIMEKGRIDEELQIFIEEKIQDILSTQDEQSGGWLGKEEFSSKEYLSPSSTYYHARTILYKSMLDYEYYKCAFES